MIGGGRRGPPSPAPRRCGGTGPPRPAPPPVRGNVAFRRLYAGFTLSNVGSQMAVVAIGLQVYAITGSTAAVGLVGLFALVPLVAFGLYGGSLSDHHDRPPGAPAAHPAPRA